MKTGLDEYINKAMQLWHQYGAPNIGRADSLLNKASRIVSDSHIFMPNFGGQVLAFIPDEVKAFVSHNALATGILGVAAVFLYGDFKRKWPTVAALAIGVYVPCFLAEGMNAAYGAFGVLAIFALSCLARKAINFAVTCAAVMFIWSLIR